jgi:hypothetical protein
VIQLSFKQYNHKIKQNENKDFIFCIIRKKWLVLTPEEWVRQNIIWYLIEFGYPKTTIAVEKQFTIQDVKKRFDIVVYQANNIFMLIECKEMNVPLNSAVLQQVLEYNSILQSHYVLITNGNKTLVWQLQPTLQSLDNIPLY